MDVQQVGANWRPGPPFTSPRINYYLQSILVIILALDTSSNLLLEPFPPTLSLSTPYFYLLELVWLATFAINPMSPRTHSSTSPVTASSMMHITISFMLLYLSPLLLRTLAYPTKSTELDTPAISTEAGRGDSDGLPDKSCDKGGANANTTGIDYSQGPPYVRFVLAYTDKNDIKNGTQDARVVVGIPSCTKWMKAKGSLLTELDSTYNSKSLQTMNMNKKSKSQDEEEESRKFCQSFRLRYTPNGRHNFQKAYVTTRFDPTSNIGWITSDNDKAPTVSDRASIADEVSLSSDRMHQADLLSRMLS